MWGGYEEVFEPRSGEELLDPGRLPLLCSRLRDFDVPVPRVREPPQSASLTLPIPVGCEAGSVDLPGTETAQGRFKLVVGVRLCGCPCNEIEENI